jgi:hypothetical protein
MTTLDEDVKLSSIDSMFDDDHFVCCKVEENFAGVTKAFCGAATVLDGTDQEWVDEVGCEACNKVAKEDEWYCPLGYDCENEDLDE